MCRPIFIWKKNILIYFNVQLIVSYLISITYVNRQLINGISKLSTVLKKIIRNNVSANFVEDIFNTFVRSHIKQDVNNL